MTAVPHIYLDHAAATPVDDAVLRVMLPYYQSQFYNPSATYTAARSVHKALDAARSSVAHWLGARANEIVFTAGGSEANNLAIHGIMRQFPGADMVVSAVEHESVLHAAAHYTCQQVSVNPDGRIDVEKLKAAISDSTVLVSVMYANNEVGTVQPIKDIALMVQSIKTARRKNGNTLPLYLHTDACQAANYLDMQVARLGVDMMTLNGGKIYGPKQSGALCVKAGLALTPLIDGGGQEHGLRSGTENVAQAVGFAAALDQAQTMRHQESERLATLQQHFYQTLAQRIPSSIVNGSLKFRLPNNVHVTLPGADNERLLFALDEQGILAAAGSACSASDEEPSHVLKAMGVSDDDAQASLRFTMGRDTTEQMIDQTVEALSSLYQIS